ncbi:RIKEN cDNA 4930556P03 [Mus musculus]|nr:RIKEN cDNA 4930556P03 [Mus musculus]
MAAGGTLSRGGVGEAVEEEHPGGSGTRGRPVRKFPSLFPLPPSRAKAPPSAPGASSAALPSRGSREEADSRARRGV